MEIGKDKYVIINLTPETYQHKQKHIGEVEKVNPVLRVNKYFQTEEEARKSKDFKSDDKIVTKTEYSKMKSEYKKQLKEVRR